MSVPIIPTFQLPILHKPFSHKLQQLTLYSICNIQSIINTTQENLTLLTSPIIEQEWKNLKLRLTITGTNTFQQYQL